jgi:hypothetical protein
LWAGWLKTSARHLSLRKQVLFGIAAGASPCIAIDGSIRNLNHETLDQILPQRGTRCRTNRIDRPSACSTRGGRYSALFRAVKTTVSYNGRTVTIISLHDAKGYRNCLLTPTGFTFAGSGAFSAANGLWLAAAAPPDNGGTYRFVDSNTAICSNAMGQTVTWKRDSTPLPQGIAFPSQPEAAAATPPRSHQYPSAEAGARQNVA